MMLELGFKLGYIVGETKEKVNQIIKKEDVKEPVVDLIYKEALAHGTKEEIQDAKEILDDVYDHQSETYNRAYIDGLLDGALAVVGSYVIGAGVRAIGQKFLK